MSKEYIIRSGQKTIYLDKDQDGMHVSIRVLGGQAWVILDREESLKLLEAVKDIMEEE